MQITMMKESDVLLLENDHPRLCEINEAFGEGAAVTWTIIQLNDLVEFMGSTQKLTQSQLEQTAQILAHSYRFMKVSDLMLYFIRFKSGAYGRFYGAVDPSLILGNISAYREYRAIEEEGVMKKLADERFQHSCKRAISYEEYCRLKEDEQRTA